MTTGWTIDKTVNLPTLIPVVVIALSGLWWLANLQFQVNQNTADMAAWKVQWAQFTASRDLSVRSYEQRMTTQEVLGKEIMRRLDDIAADIQRLQPVVIEPPRR